MIRDMHTENNSDKKSDRMMIGFLIILTLFFVSTLIGWYGLNHIKTEVSSIKADIENLKRQTPSPSAPEQTEYIKAIEFMQTETEKYREFVQQQQEFVIWLLGLIAAGFAALLTFWGIKSKKDIANVFRNEYKILANDEITRFIGGQRKIQYLAKSIQKEESARNKKILFLLQSDADENLCRICDSLRTQRYQSDFKTINGILSNSDIQSILNGCDLVIYQVSSFEFLEAGNPKEDLNFVKIAKTCNDDNVFCILYCPKRIKTEFCDLSFFVNTANYGSTALERIHNILYYMQE